MLKQISELSDFLTPNTRFFRLIAIVLLATIVIARFPWVNGLVARIMNIPDLRHNVKIESSEDGEKLVEIDVVNIGQVKATGVFLHFQISNGQISNYLIESQEIFQNKEIDKSKGLINIWMDRIAPGARVHMEVLGKFDSQQINFSVISDQGASIEMDLPSFSSQVSNYAKSVTSLLEESKIIVKENFPKSYNIKSLEGKILGFSELVRFFQKDEIKTLLLAILFTSLLIGLFIPRLTIIVPFLAAFGIWLLADFSISAGFMIILSLVTLLLPYLIFSLTSSTLFQGAKEGLWSILIIIVMGLLFGYLLWTEPASARWLSVATFFLVIDIMMMISLIMPPEKELAPSNNTIIIDKGGGKSPDANQVFDLGPINHLERKLEEQEKSLNLLTQKYKALFRVIREMGQSIDKPKEFEEPDTAKDINFE